MRVVITDGGRNAAGFKGTASGDCVARSIAIVTGKSYREVYQRLATETGNQRATKRTGKRGMTAAEGINTRRKWFKEYMAELGLVWTPTMGIGTGCRVHLTDGELPMGRLVVSLSKHMTAVIDGVIHDVYDPQRETIVTASGWPHRIARRCVYGYYRLEK